MVNNEETYRVIVMNPYGSVISNGSRVTVLNIVSDDFNALSLNTSTWTKIDPVGDAKLTMEGTGSQNALLNITVPAGVSHDVWRAAGVLTGGNNGSRIMQTANNSDFEIQTKFQSQMTQAFQMQGIIVQQDNDNYLRFDFTRNVTAINVFAATFVNGSAPVAKINVGITPNNSYLYMRINRTGDNWKQFYSTDGTNWTLAGSFNHPLTVSMIGPFIGNSGTSTPAFTGLVDYFFNTSSPSVPEDEIDTTPPNISIWYGKSQKFGQNDVPQKWVNILGNVNDPSGIASLNYSLNNGIASPLSMGPDTLRLQSAGDFNVEINHSTLLCGNNQLVIRAADKVGNLKNETVSINYSCNKVIPKTYSINWNNVTNITDVAQITDGLWIKEANSIRPAIIGYDRMITIGNMTWDDYEITAPFTLNAPLNSASPSGGPNFGFGMRWQGHYDSVPPVQPRYVWDPLGALGVYIWNNTARDFQLSLIGNGMKVLDHDASGRHLSVGVTYVFKMRAETIVSNTLYSLKVWEQGTPEPLGWTISGYGPATELKHGSITVTSHYADVSIGNISIKPAPLDPAPPVISDVSVDTIANSATVHWITNKVTTSNLSYGLTTAYEIGTQIDGNKLLVHSVTLTNLTQGTLYHYKIKSTDNGGNSTNTSDLNFTTKQVNRVISDDFHAPTLNNSIWTKIDPKGDATFSIEGNGTSNALLNITIPGGTSHDVWRANGTGGNDGARIMQFVSNNDFEIQTKFQSQPTSAYQMQGIIIEQDSDNYIRFDFVKWPTAFNVYAARFTAGSLPYGYSTAITSGNPLYMKIKRTGDNWNQSYSYDGTTWINAANFNQALTVTSVGPFVGNAAGTASPAFTGLFDYVFNTASPIVPEDPVPPTPPTITVQPGNRTAINGSGTTFSVVVAGSEPLSYQWKKNGVNIISATGASYTTAAVSPSDIGTKFSVYVWNAYGNVTSNNATLSVIEPIDIPWWNTTYNFRVPITVNAASYERYEKPVDVSLDFTRMLSVLGQTGTFAENSIRIVEIDSQGAILNDEVQFQFDNDTGFNAATKASGTLVFIMNGTTRANQNRYYQVYYGLTGGSYLPLTVTPRLTLTDNVMDEEQTSYQVGAAGSTYYFQKEAGGFSSLVDASGNDWINFHQLPAGAGGIFRGIPNVYEGGIFHPGHKNASSSIVSRGPLKIRVKAVSTNGKWESFWDFYPGYATMTMAKAGGNYWWLYEGTPGGVLEPSKDFMVRSDNKKTLLSQTTLDDITTQEWAYFSDPTINRSLFVSHHEDDTLVDEYWPMPISGGLMTVFGFGRGNSIASLTPASVPQHFTMGLMDGTEFAQSSKTIYSAYKDLNIAKGAVEQYDNANPPIIITHPVDSYVLNGSSAKFNVSAVGQLPLSYQWKRNGVNISGATSASYTVPSANMSYNGSIFTVVVSNAIDSVTSNPAKLSVGNQVVLLDLVYTHTGSANTGTRAFSFIDLPPGIPSNLISPIDYANGTLYQRMEVISKPSAKSVLYKFCIFQDQIIPERHTCTTTGNLKFTGTGTYYSSQSMPTLYQYGNNQWDRNFLIEMLVVNDFAGNPVDDRYGWLGTWSGSPDFSLYYPMKVHYTAIIVPPGDGLPVWAPLVSPSITTQPANPTTVMLGQTATFSVVATGTGPLYYQWQKNGVNISGAHSSLYTTPSVTMADNGSRYSVVVTNEMGSVTSNNADIAVSININILTNPGFESGTTPWKVYPTNMAFVRVSPGKEGTYAAKLSMSSPPKDTQLYQPGLTVEPNTRYRLSFWAYSTTGHDLRVKLNKTLSPYTTYGLNTEVNLSTDWQYYSVEFNSTVASKVTDGTFQFYLYPYMKTGDLYYIDDVKLAIVVDTPQITGKSPAGANIPVTARITLNFSETMNNASVESAFSTSPHITGSFSWIGNVMTYTPDSNLAYNQTYNVTVGTGAKNLALIGMSAPYEWNFTTMDQDLKAPEVIGNSPTGTDVYIGSVINVTFSEAMNQSSVQSAFQIDPSITGTISWNGNTMTYTPLLNLAYTRTYNVTVGTGAKDLAGNGLSAPYEWNFTTMSPDTTAPEVIGNSPTGTDVSLAAKITVNFSEAMNKSSVQSAFQTVPSIAGTISWNGNMMTYTPVSNLSYNATYNVTVGTGAKDLSGNNLNLFQWQFITVPDTTAPEIIGNTPTGSNNPVTSRITLTFSEAMNQTSVESAFSTFPNITGSFSWNGNNMTYNPGSILSLGTTYTVTIGSGARDMAGNMLSPLTWHFTTSVPSENLITNPGFESGTAPWVAYPTTSLAFSTVSPGTEGNKSAKLTINSIAVNIQLYQPNVKTIEPNTRYRLSFAAYSTTGHDLRVRLNKTLKPYTTYGLDSVVDLGTAWQDYSVEFNTTVTSNVTDACLQFYLYGLAAKTDIYYIDNVRLEKVIDVSPIPPEVVGNTPVGMIIPVTAKISVNFSKPMNQAFTQAAFSTSPVLTGSFTWSGNNMIYTPGLNFNYNTTYNVTIGTGAMDSTGNNMLSPYNWTFTTAPDTTSPTVIGKTPTGTNEPVTTKITVTFSEAMNNASVESAFSTFPGTNGNFSWSGNVMTYTPDSNLAYGTTYIVTVGTGAKDIAGNSLNLAYNWPFITLTLDTTPPTVSGNTPTGTNEPINTKITVTFNETMNKSSAQSAFSISPYISGSFSWSGNVMTYTPANLAYNQMYNVTVGTDAMDQAGNNLSAPYEWNFTTTGPDLTQPTVIGNSPTGTNVPVTAKIIVNFSEEMNHSSVESSFFTINATTGSFSWSGNNMTYTPGSNLEYSKTYTVIIGTGAKDMAGNNLNLSQWQFTTIPDTTLPEITGKTPTGSNIPVTSGITVNFSKAMNHASVESAFSTTPNTTGSFSWSGNNVTYTPYSALNFSINYTVTIGSGATDLAGNVLSPYNWQFTTASSPLNNLISNPGFESGKTPWLVYPTTSILYSTVSPGSEGLYTAKLGFSFTTVPVNLQFYQPNIKNLEPNTRYRLSFVANSTTGHDVRVKLNKTLRPYNTYGLDSVVDLSTTMQEYSVEFTTINADVTDGCLQFYLYPFAAKTDIYYIDNVRLEKV